MTPHRAAAALFHRAAYRFREAGEATNAASCLKRAADALGKAALDQPKGSAERGAAESKALELLKEATCKLAQVFGKEHPDTQMMMARLNDAARAAEMRPSGCAESPSPSPALTPAPVMGTVSGLVSAAELNGCSAEVLSWKKARGRYQCRVSKHNGSCCSVAIKPGNLLLSPGTAVTVCGVTSVSA